MRELCLRCLRSQKVCFCAKLPLLAVQQHYVILQHPKERKNPVGTGRMTAQMLLGAQLWEAVSFQEHQGLAALLEKRQEFFPVVLYPGADALNLSQAQGQKQLKADAKGRRLAVFIIDGTWALAKKMMKLTPLLHDLPKISFNPPFVSAYRIRHQPLPECLSSLESTAVLLGLLQQAGLEGPGEFSKLMLAAFAQLVEQQLEFQKNPDLNRHRANHIHRSKDEVTAPPPKKRLRPRPLFFQKENYLTQDFR